MLQLHLENGTVTYLRKISTLSSISDDKSNSTSFKRKEQFENLRIKRVLKG